DGQKIAGSAPKRGTAGRRLCHWRETPNVSGPPSIQGDLHMTFWTSLRRMGRRPEKARREVRHRRLVVGRLEDRTLLSFEGARSFDAGGGVAALAVGDFNGDGILDVVTASAGFSSSVNLLLGNGDGTFQPPRRFTIIEQPRSIVVGDFRHNGHLDV